jgi:malate dehydrogenase (oxaloacetate-decarboxylating)(NADP+)
MAYSPGVADPCLEIKANPELAYAYTSKGNMVAVVSDGSAVLGLGDIGPLAGTPVMEGKSVLFKRFAAIDSIGICLDHVRDANGKTDPKKVIEVTAALEPSFGGINLEDIGAPACFEIEQELIKRMTIPVFHDDQHGTAIICLAAILNALKLAGKTIETAKFVVNGAGAAGISCARMCVLAGARKENMILCDVDGILYRGRTKNMTSQMAEFAAETPARTLADAAKGADVLLGVSAPNCFTKAIVSSLADKSVVLAMANPVPEIMPQDALDAGAFVVGTGRSDFANQVNNVLGFPGLFRGALDVRATIINEEMKMAASMALVSLARQAVPAEIKAYLSDVYPADAAAGVFDGECPLKPSYVIPKPFDPRVVPHVARCVAEAAIKTGVARLTINDLDEYEVKIAAMIADS